MPEVRGVSGITAEIIQKEATVVLMRSMVNQRLRNDSLSSKLCTLDQVDLRTGFRNALFRSVLC
jgi:hypothetical protein